MTRATWWPGTALASGGVLWAAHGTLTMLKPWGPEVQFAEDRGYSVVVDDVLFVLYNGPGAAALLLTSLGMLALRRRLRSRKPVLTALGTLSVRLAIAFAVVSVVGVVVLLDPVFTAARVFGALLLGLAGVLLAAGVRPDSSPRGWNLWCAATGMLLLGLLPLWPLVYAVQLVPEWAGAAYFVVLAALLLVGVRRVPPPRAALP